MAKLKYLACIIMVSAALYRPAMVQAAQITLGNLYEFCTSTDEAAKNACTFYILGVFEGAQIGGATVQGKTGSFEEAKDKRFCVPPGLKSSAMELTVKMKMGSDLAVFPQDRDMPAVSFITAVIAQQFPCHKPK
ncbi:Rap1a/Tai family immunity protein [Granulicella sp. S190]|uniref:Rap1a/Tai family immunity protein n=1 Tax=Granulicella sp. S190 TaxID=1747226 RepID=UPI00131B6D8C|nr:Rap1a/Tai family immunity protein [Granulicella sp. S190]